MKAIIFVIGLIFAVAKGQIRDFTTYNLSAERSNDYIRLNRMQYAQAVKNFDLQIESFKEKYLGRTEGMQIQLEMTTASIVQIEERLTPLEIMSDVGNKCVVKYRTTIPTVTTTTRVIKRCIDEATSQLNDMLDRPLVYRNDVKDYLISNFEEKTNDCGKNFDKSTEDYTSCITTVTNDTNHNLITYQKTFSNYMDKAECTAKANIKAALDCTYTVQTRTSAAIAEANVLIHNCVLGMDEWMSCPAICPDSRDFIVSYTNRTILNPFYGLQSHKGCLLLNIKN